MYNISLDSEPIKLKSNTVYYLIDGLYIDNINEGLPLLDSNDIDTEIRRKLFPYTDDPFAKFRSLSNEFSLSQIKDADQTEPVDNTFFGSDTGLILIINELVFFQFIKQFNYGDLVDSDKDIIDYKYWENITMGYEFEDVGLIISAGEKSPFDFKGSGGYKVIID
jgi:hypothetical protein